jgi:RNA polymerase sigma factor (TIGR02999 family)
MAVSDVTVMLEALERGEAHVAAELLPLVYDELRRLAAANLANEAPGQTLQATALVHEAYLRLVGTGAREMQWTGRRHFFAAAALAMRNILVDQARRRRRIKRGGDADRVPFDEGLAITEPADTDVLALDEALTELAKIDQPAAELVNLRYFAGLTNEEAAASLGCSPRTAERLWTYAKAWLFKRLSAGE